MTFPTLQSLTAQAADVAADAPTWAPILFAAGAFVVVVLVLILVRQKLKASEQWRHDPDNPGPRQPDPEHPGPENHPPENPGPDGPPDR
ncbi:hypothetical protein [Nesterenkonia alba]|uniref:hypothetical protein n=1 Tax=Nesterenkonia alba TaxID=515814 RepID=UPI0003B6820F|nr:hypothetical protein [Nesterenkonia alba]